MLPLGCTHPRKAAQVTLPAATCEWVGGSLTGAPRHTRDGQVLTMGAA